MDGSANRRSVLNAVSRQKRARKPSARERVDEFVNKHPVGVPVGFAATALLGGAIVGATVTRHASAPRDTGHSPIIRHQPIRHTGEPVHLARIYGTEGKRTPALEAGLTTPAASTEAKPVIPQTAKPVDALYTEPYAQLSCGTHLVVLGAKLPVVCDASGRPRGIRFTAKDNSPAQQWDAEMSVLGCMPSPNATIVEIDCGEGGVIPALALYLRALAESQQNGGLAFLLALDQRETRKRLEKSLSEIIVKWVADAETNEDTQALALGGQSEDLWLVDEFARLHRVSVVVWSCEPGKAATRIHQTEIEKSKESADLERSMDTNLNLRVASERYTLLAKAPEAGLTTPAASTPVSMAVLPAEATPVIPQTAKPVDALYTEPDAQLSCGTHLVVLGAKFPVVCHASGGARAISVTAEESPLLFRWGASISVLECATNATIVEIDCGGGGVIPLLALYQYARAHPDRKQGPDVMDETDTQLETMQKTNLEIELHDEIYRWLVAPEAAQAEKEARAKAHGKVFDTNLPLVDAFSRVYGVSVIVWKCLPRKRATRFHPKGKESADLERSMDTNLNLRVASERYTLLARF